MRSCRSGRLGEQFCRDTFGIGEPRYEIKSTGYHRVVIQCCQLLDSLHKQYVIVRYHRTTGTIKRGARKGCKKHIETIEQAYQKPVDVIVVRGDALLRVVHERKLAIGLSTNKHRILETGRFAAYWVVPLAELPYGEAYVIEKTNKYVLHARSLDPPGWMGDLVAEEQGSLFADRKKKKKKKDDEVPF